MKRKRWDTRETRIIWRRGKYTNKSKRPTEDSFRDKNCPSVLPEWANEKIYDLSVEVVPSSLPLFCYPLVDSEIKNWKLHLARNNCDRIIYSIVGRGIPEIDTRDSTVTIRVGQNACSSYARSREHALNDCLSGFLRRSQRVLRRLRRLRREREGVYVVGGTPQSIGLCPYCVTF